MYIADLHIHSHYSRATSRDCTPEYLDLWARRKGINLIGSGDFTHPAWRQELEEKLEPDGNGFYLLKKEYRIEDNTTADNIWPHFVITGEISSIYKKHDRVRKVHSLILLPGLKEAGLVSRKLETIGNIHSDGRPILGLDCHDLLEILLELCPEAVYVPAHIWTPHFSLFGAFSGFDSVEECFGDLSRYIYAMETGLSSDPPMNWRVSALDRYQLISNSDAHSPAKLGREANLFDIELSYEALRKAIETGDGLMGTIEFFPEEGKYHYDGHRKCGICLAPSETVKYGGVCPVCGRKLTIGVSHRIEQLSDRPEGYRRPEAAGFESLVPLPEVIGASLGCSSASSRVEKVYRAMIGKLGPEFSILRELPLEEIGHISGGRVADGIGRLRRGEAVWRPGFDGEYGSLRLFTRSEIEQLDGQMSLFGRQTDTPAAGTGEEACKNPEKEELRCGTEDMSLQAENLKRNRKVQGFFPEETVKTKRQEPVWNEQQRQAIESVERVTVVKAGPGTGKTGTLAAHILHLMETRRVSPSCITAVTFTNQAAGELRERIQKQLGKGPAKKIQIGSFHSIAWKILKDRGVDFSLAGEMETRELVGKIKKEYGLKQSVSQLLMQISNDKTGMGEMDSCLEKEILETYQNSLREWGAMDFDDILLEALRIVKEEAGEKEQCADAGAFSYLLVDEFQDINPLQYQLIKAWNKGGRELFVIGDKDQAIYGFRGACAGCFEKLTEDFKGACQIILEENYRSTPEILAAASEVISKNPGRKRVLNPNRPKGAPVRIIETDSEKAEAIFVAKEVNRLTGGMGMLEAHELFLAEEGNAWGFEDIAILYRTHRQATLLEECLKKEGIPYVVAGREEFLQEETVRGTICFFKALLQPDDKLAVRTALTLLWNSETESQAAGSYEAMVEKYTPQLKRKKPQKILEEWMKDLKLEEKKEMQKLYQTSVFYQKMPEFLEALETGAESDLKRCGGKQYKAGAVTLMTLHGSKGLEFPVVMIYGARKGFIPFAGGKGSSDEEEERRLFYVGLTRAREALILTSSRGPSPFLEEIPPGFANREKVRTGKREEEYGRQMSLFEFM
ncbi:MAG: UvrD-helicase domain-containing protein [Lachnospiraceae bacterium]|nr:UvrD-helicase domain-containing protein [Lachnospiraceae bacterium]